MVDREHRPKASEVHAKANYVFVTKVPFAEAFPEIATMQAKVTEGGRGAEGGRTHYCTEATAGEFIDCSNPICYRGGIQLGRVLREMVGDRQTQREFSGLCQGNEASPKGKRVYRKCTNYFKGTISITYRPDGRQELAKDQPSEQPDGLKD